MCRKCELALQSVVVPAVDHSAATHWYTVNKIWRAHSSASRPVQGTVSLLWSLSTPVISPFSFCMTSVSVCPGLQQKESEIQLRCLGTSGMVVSITLCPFHSHCVLPLVPQLHTSFCQTSSVTSQGYNSACVAHMPVLYMGTQLLLLHSGRVQCLGLMVIRSAGSSRCSLRTSSWGQAVTSFRTQSSGSSCQQTEYRLLASGASLTC